MSEHSQTQYEEDRVVKPDPLDGIEEKWDTEPATAAEWERRARWALGLTRKWKRNALEWEESARAD